MTRIAPRLHRLSRRRFVALGASTAAFGIIGRAKAATGTVTFYSTMPTNYAGEMTDAFNATHKDLKLEMFFVNGFELYERARAEYASGRIKHDIIMLTDPSLFVTLKKDNRLHGYVSPEVANYPASQRDPDGLWCNGRTVLNVYGYNTKNVTDGANYRGWADFLNPKLAGGKIGVISPLEAGSALQNYYNIRNTPELGLKWWQELAKLNPTVGPSPGAMTSGNISGQLSIAMNNDYLIYEEKKKNPSAPKMTAVYPREVVTATIIPMAMVKNSPNPEGAKVVFDWWLSKEGQTKLRDVNSIYSPRADVPPLEGLPKFADLPIKVAPTEELDKGRDAMQKEFKELFKL